MFAFVARVCLAVIGLMGIAPALGAAGSTLPDRILYSFLRNGLDGAWPASSLTADARGGFYGTATAGGSPACTDGCGVVFHLIARVKGDGFVAKAIHRFKWSNPSDGSGPSGGLIADASGALYGATAFGGNTACQSGCGTLYKLTPHGDTFSESVIYSFSGGADGSDPRGPLVLDARGNLFGTASNGGAQGAGVVFELMPSGKTHTLRVLYTFGSGQNPTGPLLGDARGNFYGLTSGGFGTVYMLSPSAKNDYTESTLYSFLDGNDGAGPEGPLSFGPHGEIYGTASFGGAYNNGVVFSLSPTAHAEGDERVIHTFSSIGSQPCCGVFVDRYGTLYGTTDYDHAKPCAHFSCGILFRMVPDHGVFDYTILHIFGFGHDGGYPTGVIAGPNGELYGTTIFGGAYGAGTVYRIR